MNYKAKLPLLILLLMLFISGVAEFVTAQTPESSQPQSVMIEVTFFSVNHDVDILNGGPVLSNTGPTVSLAAFQNLVKKYASGKKKKLHIWSSHSKVINVGQSYDLMLPNEDQEVERINIQTSEYGDNGREIALAIAARKTRQETSGSIYSPIYNWSFSTNVVLPVDSVTIFGGQEGDPLLGRKSKKKLPPQLLYVAVSIRKVSR